MAYSGLFGNNGLAVNNEGTYMEFICDTAADVPSLPDGGGDTHSCAQPRPGSMALVIAEKQLWTLNCVHKWVCLGAWS